MSFLEFFQQNIILFIAGAGILAFLLATELRNLGTRGQTLTPALLTQQVNHGALLIDLRKPEDYQKAHITGAKNIPMQTLKDQVEALGDKDQAIALYCYGGNLSHSALSLLRKAGFTNVSHLGGGMKAWQQENLPVVNG